MNDAKNLLKVPQPNYIKIDVDGIEHLILKCGEKVLLNTKEILIEINENFEKQSKEALDLLLINFFSHTNFSSFFHVHMANSFKVPKNRNF